jgi:polysaccharide export outer membrane protein
MGRNLSGTVINTEIGDAAILPGNTLRIIVSSTNLLDTKEFKQFNLLPLISIDPSITRVSNDMTFQSYKVDEDGYIEFPILGKIKVQGLTHIELETLLQGKLKQYISDPIVKISIGRNWVKVFGEVGAPGLHSIDTKFRYSILDVLAEAGGITSYGDKKRIKLIREENGRLESAMLDLTSSDIFTSPYYYLKPNDIIVVDLNSRRKKDAQYGASDNYKLSIISTIVGSVSIIASMIIAITSTNKISAQ